MSAARVYACFDAAGSGGPAATDLKYYFLLRAWSLRAPLVRRYVDVHRAAARRPRPRDLRRELARRLKQSDLLLIILSERTRHSAGWLSWEISFAAHTCRLPIVCAYTRCREGSQVERRAWWPDVLHDVAAHKVTDLAHVPFRPQMLAEVFTRVGRRRSVVV
ncbi:MAG TPA: TIR domain-containing protein [Kofleriaceae bacterium]|nr:TIR domain-containing protein [Kofleriaceae bacterium]